MDNQKITIILLLTYGIIILGVIMYISSKYNEETNRCNIINSNTKKLTQNMLPDDKPIKSYTDNNSITCTSLVNSHIKTAYNCCAINTFKNSFVSECAF